MEEFQEKNQEFQEQMFLVEFVEKYLDKNLKDLLLES